jgi:hypothetical protein
VPAAMTVFPSMVTLPSAIAVSAALRDNPKRHLFNLTPVEIKSPDSKFLFLFRTTSFDPELRDWRIGRDLSTLFFKIPPLSSTSSAFEHKEVVEGIIEQ